jgi:hypothetical protein
MMNSCVHCWSACGLWEPPWRLMAIRRRVRQQQKPRQPVGGSPPAATGNSLQSAASRCGACSQPVMRSHNNSWQSSARFPPARAAAMEFRVWPLVISDCGRTRESAGREAIDRHGHVLEGM